jgi:cytochrome c peroxidase
MHDGRMTSLEQVVEFYNSGVQANANLDGRLRSPGGQPQRLNLRTDEKTALVAYLRTLTDPAFLAAAKFADPFPR